MPNRGIRQRALDLATEGRVMQKESKAQMEEQGEIVLALALTSSGLRVSLASAIYGTGRAQPLVIPPLPVTSC